MFAETTACQICGGFLRHGVYVIAWVIKDNYHHNSPNVEVETYTAVFQETVLLFSGLTDNIDEKMLIRSIYKKSSIIKNYLLISM